MALYCFMLAVLFVCAAWATPDDSLVQQLLEENENSKAQFQKFEVELKSVISELNSVKSELARYQVLTTFESENCSFSVDLA